MKGGNISFVMTNNPTNFGNKDFPSTSINDNFIVLNPIIDGGDVSFSGNKIIKIYSEQKGVKIYYTLNGEMPDAKSTLYKMPFQISSSEKVKAIAVNKNGKISKPTTAQFHHLTHDWSIISSAPYEPEYAAGGSNALIDELNGTTDWRKGNWQGFQKNDVSVVIDLKKVETISKVSVNFLQDTRAWIVMPKQISIEVSTDGKTFKNVFNESNFLPIEDLKVQTKNIEATFPSIQARFVRVKAFQYGKLPSWHEGAGNDSHIFIDEIEVK
ncbi:MAG: chitobiase/beta-hexosaminidase C-terminal domain-containing protein, partial [Bacteroidota bacterium]|nr:chitobiase/beta-hexosaminidase C-terminal domain-containing protein [Bacteroidota bacterium]